MAVVDDLRVRRVLQAAEAISGDRGKAVVWLQEPIATFGGKTALELVAAGAPMTCWVTLPRSNPVTSVDLPALDEHVTSVAR
ncbi:DUF2384 domain-containing protein [Luteibacter flocculans]|uniref:DUF2384 domain-containing protein n=1 Tax=Luteibacter flocculans TaxID=2780091 RepID=A0ABY4T3L9_9GAMM|nr:DUF2384 domain-containing protein [Luteibacter flocculans]